jgi:plasmid stability protein
MAKVQLKVRLDEALAATLKAEASKHGQSVQKYVEELIEDGIGGPRTRFFEAAEKFMADFGADFERDFGPGGAR